MAMKAAGVSHENISEATVSKGTRNPLPEALAGLLTADAYPHPLEAVRVIETPISWVVLAGQFAYKIKRPVRYPFVDQRTLERRRCLCEEELRLNRRFAAQLYLQVCRITTVGTRTRMQLEADGAGKVIEYAVRMKRFEAADMLERRLADGRIAPQVLAAFGRTLADIHATLPTVAPDAPWGQPASIHALLMGNLLECATASKQFSRRESVAALRVPLEQRLGQTSAWMAVRRMAGRVRECHGDLHSRNIVMRGERLVAFDCVEYEPAFRWIDVADEIAFLSSDLLAHGYPLDAHAFLGAYLEHSGDYHACRVIKLYEAHRALVRAKVAALSAGLHPRSGEHAAFRQEHERLVAHAASVLAIQHPRLVLMHGVSGAGKTRLARQIAQHLQAIHLRSDVERKRRAGLKSLELSGSGLESGLYANEVSTRVYADLAGAAEDALSGGYTVVVDATFLRREQRQCFAELANRLHLRAYVVSCTAPLTVLRERIQARAAAARDPSEADTVVLEWQRQRLEPVGADESFVSIEADSTRSGVVHAVLERLGAG